MSAVLDKTLKNQVRLERTNNRRAWLIPILVIVSLWLISRYNFLLFHTFAELFAITIALILSVVAWYTYDFSRNNFLVYLGAGYFWIGYLDLMHTLTYKGLHIMQSADPNTSIQFWIVARLFEAVLLATAASTLVRHRLQRQVAFVLFGIISLQATYAVFQGYLPVFYIDGEGLTPAKIIAEYVVIGLLLVAAGSIFHVRRLLDPTMVRLILVSIVLTITAEVIFTLYSDVYSSTIFVGHIFKFLSYWLIFQAVVKISLARPYRAMVRASSTYDAIPAPTLVVDRSGRIKQANRAALKVAGKSAQEILDRDCHELFHPAGIERDQCVVCDHIHHGRPLTDYELQYPDGQWREISLAPVNNLAGFNGLVHVSPVVTARKTAEAQLLKQAHFDQLSGLPNRSLVTDRLHQLLRWSEREGKSLAVIFVDLDNFKHINDSLGHGVGDQVLIQIAEHLTRTVRESDTVARWGGDEFIVIASDLNDVHEAELVCNKILTALSIPVNVEGREFQVGASLGVSGYPDDARDVSTLLSHADAAMYKAKEAGKNTLRFYTPEMNDSMQRRLELEGHLRKAIENGELSVYYQPIVDVLCERVTQAEALLRWHSPELGHVPPDQFIPLAEETGLIFPIGQWVIRQVCKDLRYWSESGCEPVSVAINIASIQLKRADFMPSLLETLAEFGIEPGQIKLEVTESLLLDGDDETIAKLESLSAMGLRLSMDDFGTGYSSLSYLRQFPFDEVKIDRSFVRDITTDENNAALCRAIVAMADSLGMTVIGEGVETDAQLAFLRQFGANYVQGYFFSPAVPAAAFAEFQKQMS